MTTTPRELGLHLLKTEVDEIVRQIVRQSATTAPGMNAIEPNARTRSVRHLLLSLHESLRTGNRTGAIEMAYELAALRGAAGIDIKQLIVVSHAYLPMIRRVFTARAKSPVHGLRAFEAIEGDTLEIIVTIVLRVMPDYFSQTDFPEINDEDDDVTAPDHNRRPRYSLSPFSEI